MFLWAKNTVERELNEFLSKAQLRHRPYTIPEFLQGLALAGYPVVGESFKATKQLRAAVIRVKNKYVLFYPDSPDFLAVLHAVAHESGHIVLEHHLHNQSVAANSTVFSSADEREAELFARLVVIKRVELEKPDKAIPGSMSNYFLKMDEG